MKKQWMAMVLCLVMMTGCLEAPSVDRNPDVDMSQDVKLDVQGDTDASEDTSQDMEPVCSCDDGQVCDGEGLCVQCLDDDGCSDTGVCEGGSCVACREGGDGCDGEDVCDVESGEPTCVQCIQDTDCASGVCSDNACVVCISERGCQGTQVCNTLVPGGECVACIGDEQCDSPGAPVCDLGSNTCTGCDNPTQCEGFFESSICLNQACVECEAATERDDCAVGGKRRSCLRDSNTCSDTELGSVAQGMPCQADSECLDGACIELTYTGDGGPRELGGVCLKLRSGTCPEGFERTVRLSSVDGAAPDARCGLNLSKTTPKAILEVLGAQKRCSTPDECGEPGLGDATCLDGGRNTCSPGCLNDSDCPTGIMCFQGFCDF